MWVCSKGLYGCTYSLFHWLQERFQIRFSMCSMMEEAVLEKAIRPETRCFYIETPMNPTLELVNLELVSTVARRHGIVTIVDNTLMSPYLQRPLEWGCDIVLHSATKYIGGHGDVIAGIAAGPRHLLGNVKKTTLKDLGAILSPMDAYLLIRGLKTLEVRMDRHCENAGKIARFFGGTPQSETGILPGTFFFPSG